MKRFACLLLVVVVCFAQITSVPPTPAGGACLLVYGDQQDNTRLGYLHNVVTDSIDRFGPGTAYNCRIVTWTGDISENMYCGDSDTPLACSPGGKSTVERDTLNTECDRLEAAGFSVLYGGGNHDYPPSTALDPTIAARFFRDRLQPSGVKKVWFDDTYVEPDGGHAWYAFTYTLKLGDRPLFVAYMGPGYPSPGLIPTLEGGQTAAEGTNTVAARGAWFMTRVNAWRNASEENRTRGIIIAQSHAGWQGCTTGDLFTGNPWPGLTAWMRDQLKPAAWITGHWPAVDPKSNYRVGDPFPHIQTNYQQGTCGFCEFLCPGILMVMTISAGGEVTYCPWDSINHVWYDTNMCGKFRIKLPEALGVDGKLSVSGKFSVIP